MSTAIASVDVDRLGKLLRLALVADQAGEITGAIHALKRALASAGLDPHYVVDAFERGTKSITAPLAADDNPGHDDDDDTSLVWFAWHRRDRLSPRDRQFVEGLARWRGPLSTKQQKWLHDVLDKLAEAA
jgi:hypothetical protein